VFRQIIQSFCDIRSRDLQCPQFSFKPLRRISYELVAEQEDIHQVAMLEDATIEDCHDLAFDKVRIDSVGYTTPSTVRISVLSAHTIRVTSIGISIRLYSTSGFHRARITVRTLVTPHQPCSRVSASVVTELTVQSGEESLPE